MSLEYGELRPTNGWDRLAGLGYPIIFQRVPRFDSVTARHSSSGRQPNCGVAQRAPPMFGRETITLGIIQHSSGIWPTTRTNTTSLSIDQWQPHESWRYFRRTLTHVIRAHGCNRQIDRQDYYGNTALCTNRAVKSIWHLSDESRVQIRIWSVPLLNISTIVWIIPRIRANVNIYFVGVVQFRFVKNRNIKHTHRIWRLSHRGVRYSVYRQSWMAVFMCGHCRSVLSFCTI